MASNKFKKPERRGSKPGERRGGRQKGTPNKVTREAKQFCGGLIDDPAYQRKLGADFKQRKVHPTIEQMVWHYGRGKPVERVESGKPGDFSQMTDEQINEELRKAAEEPLV